VWALIRRTEDGAAEVVLGGHTNRNHAGFEEKFKALVGDVQARFGRG